MGSLASRPKAPDVTPVQYVYVPTASSYPPATTVANPPASAPPSTEPTAEDVQAQARSQNLLDRRRGRLSTVLTSFRGLLNDTVTGSRKALLGE